MKFWNLKDSIQAGIIASAYTALTIAVAPLSYGPIQFRISEVLDPLPYNKRFGKLPAVIGLTLGCLLANIISPYGIWDMILGTLGTLIGAIFSYLSTFIDNERIGKLIAVLSPVISNTIIVGWLLLNIVYQIPLMESIVGVFIGEIATAGFGGYIFLTALERVNK